MAMRTSRSDGTGSVPGMKRTISGYDSSTLYPEFRSQDAETGKMILSIIVREYTNRTMLAVSCPSALFAGYNQGNDSQALPNDIESSPEIISPAIPTPGFRIPE